MAPAPAAASKVLRVGILTPVRTLNPVDSVDSVSHLALAQVFETPYSLPPAAGEAAQPRLFAGPLALESQGPAGQVFSARLAAGAAFSDGTPVTAAHVVACLSRMEALSREARIEAQGDRVVFSLESPNPRFDLALTLIHSAVVLDKGGELLGSGAFMPAPGCTLDRLRLVRNPHYRRPAAIDEVAFQVYPPDQDGRAQTLVKALEAGEVDFTTMLSRNDAVAAQGVRKAFRPSNATAVLHLNTSRPALASKPLRQAITQAVDRTAVTEISYANALAFTASSLLPPGLGTAPDLYAFDPVRARQLLAQSGVALPLRLEMLVVWAPRPYIPNPQPVAALIAGQLADIGIEVTITQPKDTHDFHARRERGEYDLVLAGWIADTPDPADFLDANLRSDRVPQSGRSAVGCCNLSRLRDEDVDLALKRFREDPSPGKLGAILSRAADEAVLLPLMYGPTIVVSAFRVQNVQVPPLGLPDFSTFDLA